MNRRMTDDLRGSFMASVGWLFADLLLVLTMLFLVSNAFRFQTPLSPSPTPSTPPTPNPLANVLILEPNRVTLTLTNIDPDKLSAGKQDAITDLKRKIREQIIQKGLQYRRAGIEIAYGGADNFDQEDRGVSVATEVYNVLDMLGQERFVFCHTLHYDSLFTRLHPHDTVVIDLYLFSPSVKSC